MTFNPVTWIVNLYSFLRVDDLLTYLPKACGKIGDSIDELRLVPRLILSFWLYASYIMMNLMIDKIDTLESPALVAIGGVLTATIGYCKIYVDGKRTRSE